MLKVFSWTACPNTTQFIWVLTHGGDPEGRAKTAADEMAKRKPGDRVLFLWKAFDTVPNELDNSKEALPRQLITGYDFPITGDFYRRFFWTLHKLNAPKIDRIVLDFEGTASVWGNIGNLPDTPDRLDYMKSLYADPLLYSQMPATVKKFKPEDFLGTGDWRGSFAAWNFWVNPILLAGLKKTIERPFKKIFNYMPPITNFGDMHPTFPIYDLNQWLVQDLAWGTESSPALYLSMSGWRPILTGVKKHRRWNNFIDMLNQARSTIHACVPWISHPAYAGDNTPLTDPWLWVKLMEHLSEMGISNYLYWNADVALDATIAADTFARLTPGKVGKNKLPQIPMDADEIVTGSQKITYAEFLEKNTVIEPTI